MTTEGQTPMTRTKSAYRNVQYYSIFPAVPRLPSNIGFWIVTTGDTTLASIVQIARAISSSSKQESQRKLGFALTTGAMSDDEIDDIDVEEEGEEEEVTDLSNRYDVNPQAGGGAPYNP